MTLGMKEVFSLLFPLRLPSSHTCKFTHERTVWRVHLLLSVSSTFSAKLSLTLNYMLAVLPLDSSLSFVPRSLMIIIAWLFFFPSTQ